MVKQFINRHLIADRKFYFTVLAIALPISMQNVIGFGVNVMDSVMLGQLGDIALSAASLGGQPFFVMMITSFGITSGGAVLIAQYWGKGDISVIKYIISLTMRFAVGLSLLFFLLCLSFPKQLMSIYSKEPQVIAAAADYLFVLSFSFVAFAITNCFLMSIRGIEQVKASTIIYAISFFVNVFFNYVFIFGAFGMPRLEVKGAAIGTVIARFSELAMAIIYMTFFEKKLSMKPKDFLKIDKTLIPDYMRHGFPVLGNELIWVIGFTTTTVIIGRIGSSFVAANSIAQLVFQVASVFTFGIANTAAVLTGKCVGAGKMQEAQRTANSLLLISFILGIIGSNLMFFSRFFIVSFYNITPGTAAIAAQLILVLSLLQPFFALDVACIIGVLRGGGDTRTALVIDCIAMWCIAIPLGVVLGIVLKLPPYIVYGGMKSETFFKTVTSLIRIFSGKWIRNVTR